MHPSDPASAPNSPSSRAGTAPSDSESPAATPVVDVTGGDEPWTTTSARRTAEPTPLAPSKRPPAKTVVGAAAPGKGKGKKRLVRRPAAGSASAKKDLTGGGHESDSSLEDKPAPPPVKKPRKTPAGAKAPAAKGSTAKAPAQAKAVPSGTSQPPARASRSDGGFDLGSFMASFEPGLVSGVTAPSVNTVAATYQTQEEQRAPIDADMAGQLRELQLEVQRLRSMVASQS
ncbi:hypothetical protein BBJ28_00026491, partial [Nothophytophthora sp. Chile5]